MSFTLADCQIDLRKCLLPASALWVGSGQGTCSVLPDTALGVSGFFSPPFAAGDCRLAFELNVSGRTVVDTASHDNHYDGLLFAGGSWFPDKIVRRGSYHRCADGRLLSFAVESELVPLTGGAGFAVTLAFRNRTGDELPLTVTPLLTPGRPRLVPLKDWDYTPPRPADDEAVAVGAGVWENRGVRVTLLSEGGGLFTLNGGASRECRFAVVFTRAGEVSVSGPLADWQERTRSRWQRLLEVAAEKLPAVSSDIPGLAAYCRRSQLSGLLCLWERDDFVCNPFPATSGMDGGSLCCYPWDAAGYGAETLVMLFGARSLEFAKHLLASGIDRHVCMAPDGSGSGWCGYAYSMWSLMNLYWTALTFTGEGGGLFDAMAELFAREEQRLEERGHLKDYGNQHNLLEMRASGYEHFTPSPNAERAWCYDRLADIAERLGRGGVAAWREKAEAIRGAIRGQLWDAGRGWFKCLHPDGRAETVYSIQAFDALRAGACTPEMTRALLRHVRDGAFLGEYGVSSVSAEDELHYEMNDSDWSGRGSYTGEGPNLAEILWQVGEPRLAWDVLRRHFWMADTLPYFPQQHDCDRPLFSANSRANIIAGVAGWQAAVFGMTGLRASLDGTLTLNPQPPERGEVRIDNLKCRDVTLTVSLRPNHAEVLVNGEPRYSGVPCEVTVSAP